LAKLIPPLNQYTLSKMTAGEKRVARRLAALLEDDYWVWYDIPVGDKRRYPDFIILHPSRGILFLEVKDWKPSTVKRIRKTDVELLVSGERISTTHPLEQARASAYEVVHMLARDPKLQQMTGKYQGHLLMPYGWGAVLTHITRKQIEAAIPEDARAEVLPDYLMIYQDELRESVDAEAFQSQLWGMFHYEFGGTLTLPQIDRIRWHLFPEVRIDDMGQTLLFNDDACSTATLEQTLPDMVNIMDIQQEQLARSLGEGHRVIHGVAGSGKTLILAYRCLHLAHTLGKPILVLCFNITLAAKLRSFISARGIGGQVQVYHFHDWCAQQLEAYHIDTIVSDAPIYERQVLSVIRAVEHGAIPKGQYGALMIDEGHDFEAEWLKLVVQMVDEETNALLMLYDDAQSIYQKKGKQLDFTLSSVGIKAQGRTTILRLNYRNTQEILNFAYQFVRQYLNPKQTDEDHIPCIQPESAGNTGAIPAVRVFPNRDMEIDFIARCLKTWHEQGVPWSDMAVLYLYHWQGEHMEKKLQQQDVPYSLLKSAAQKKSYDCVADKVAVLTVHSSKGLEFPRVIMFGLGELQHEPETQHDTASLLYVGMTRAQECLLLCGSKKSALLMELQALRQQLFEPA